MRKEIKSHAMMNHPNIIKFFHLIENDDKLYMLLEYAPNGDLYKYLVDHEKFSERDACKIIAQVALALQYIHRKGILHRDLKPENILLDTNFIVKVSDFGWCGEFNKQRRQVAGPAPNRVTFCGTYEYMAPEVIRGDYQDDKVDVWSLGILLYELLHGKTPFRSSAPLDIQRNIIEGRFSIDKRLSSSAIDLLRRILRANPADRYSVDQVLSHPFVKVELNLKKEHIPNIEDFQTPVESENGAPVYHASTRTSSTEKRGVFSRKWTQSSKSQLISSSAARLLKANTGLSASGSTSKCNPDRSLSPPKHEESPFVMKGGSFKKLTLVASSREVGASSNKLGFKKDSEPRVNVFQESRSKDEVGRPEKMKTDLQDILLYMKVATSPKKHDTMPAIGRIKLTDAKSDTEGSRLRSLVQSINQSLKSSKIITEKKSSRKAGESSKVAAKKLNGVAKAPSKVQTSKKVSPSIIPEGLASRIEKLLTKPKQSYEPQNAQSATVLPQVQIQNVPVSSNIPLTARRIHRKAQFSESNHSLHMEPSPKSNIMRKLSSSSLKRVVFSKKNGSASLSKLRQDDTSRGSDKFQNNGTNLSPGRINLYNDPQNSQTEDCSPAKLSKEATGVTYYSRMSAEGRKTLDANKSLRSRDKSSNPMSNSTTSIGSALNLYRNLADKKPPRSIVK